MTTDDPADPEMPSQSPALGLLAAPSPLVSPPTESSSSEVNTTGAAAVPLTTKDPSTVNPLPQAQLLMTAPALIVNVTPAGTVKFEHPPSRTGMRLPDHGNVESTV